MRNLILGDCLVEMDRLIAQGVKVDAVITDPPYGTTACRWDSVIPFDEMWLRLNKLIKPNGAIVLFGSEPFSSALRMSNIKRYKYDWVWHKQPTGFLNAKKMPMRSIENISVFNKIKIYNPQGLTRIDAVKTRKGRETLSIHNGGEISGQYIQQYAGYPNQLLKFNTDKRKEHPTQKPVALMEYLIKTYTNEGETVLDFTMGSGTTGVACKNTNRNFIGIELDDKYFKIAKERMEHPNDK
jgi:DNA modification methylase